MLYKNEQTLTISKKLKAQDFLIFDFITKNEVYIKKN